MNKIAVYAGSFDPFTTGHYDILMQAADIFDQVYIVIAINSEKERRTNITSVERKLLELTMENNNVQIAFWNQLIVDFCDGVGAKYLIRGLRDTTDYLYEENIAKINRELNSNIKTIYFRANNETISSSMVYELYKHGKDIQKYLPYNASTLEWSE